VPSPRSELIAIAGGLIVYVLLIWRLHIWLFGVPPLA
jgi:uncharacterized membrane protein